MTDLRKAAEMALDALDAWLVADVTKLPIVIPQTENTVFALRQALAQPEQEPVDIHCPSCLHSFSIVPVAKRQWVSLTEKERRTFASWLDDKTDDEVFNAIEAKLKERNNG